MLMLKLVKSALVAAVLVSAGAPSIAQDDAVKAETATTFAAMVEREGSREAVETLFAELQSLEVRTAATVTRSHQ